MSNRAAFSLMTVVRPSLARSTTVRTATTQRRALLRPSAQPANSRRPSPRPFMTATNTPSSRPSPTSAASPAPTPGPAAYKLALLYDSDCPLCLKEVNFLRKRAAQQADPSAIKFVDIAAADYDPAAHAGIDYETAMGRIHGIDGDGNVLVGVSVFRAAYEAVGLGWVYAVTAVPGVGRVADAAYNLWADWRLQLTGRPPLEEVMRLRREEAERTCR